MGEQAAQCTAYLEGPVRGAVRRSTLPGSDVPLYLIEHNDYFHRDHPYGEGGHDYPDNLERFSFFCLATLDGIPRTGWAPDIVHCHDWHTAPIPAFIKTRCIDHPVWANKPTVFTIHNMAYQGRYASTLVPKTGLGWELFTPKYLEYYGDLNLMKAGIIFASKISTVSVTYAKEIQTEVAGHGSRAYSARDRKTSSALRTVSTRRYGTRHDKRIPANFHWPISPESRSAKRTCSCG